MIALSDQTPMTPEEYLAFEQTSEIRHEYIDGELYAMAGGTGNHNLICLNCAIALRDRLKDSGCRVYRADMKVNIAESRRYFYPDLLVTCDRRDDPTLTYTTFPKLIIEVLSPSTKGFDRRNKFEFYQTIPTLQTYLLIDAEKYRVDCFRRQTEDIWTVQFYQGITAIVEIESLDLQLPMSDIYVGIAFVNNTDNFNRE